MLRVQPLLTQLASAPHYAQHHLRAAAAPLFAAPLRPAARRSPLANRRAVATAATMGAKLSSFQQAQTTGHNDTFDFEIVTVDAPVLRDGDVLVKVRG